MNLHGLVGPIIGAVNPNFPVAVQFSNGFTVDASFKQVPAYTDPITVLAQVQPISTRDLQMLEGINLGGVKWKCYLYGAANSVVRPESKGGDLITISNGPHQGTWLVVSVLEQFPAWCSAAIVQQNGG